MTNSKRKGKEGELELARVLRTYGYDTRRGQQYSGVNGDADVVGLPGVHIEVKRYKTMTGARLAAAIKQAENDAPFNEVPAVFYREDRKDWRVCIVLAYLCMMASADAVPVATLKQHVTMALPDFMDVYKTWQEYRRGYHVD